MLAQVQAFVEAMDEFGLRPEVEAELIICHYRPAAGARANCTLEVGVATDELVGWPQAPPHWIHLPAEVEFAKTNSKASPKSGWLQHSRDCPGWGDAPPARCWIAHLQTVLSEVIQ